MPSAARLRFKDHSADIRRLFEIHTVIGGTEVGRRDRLEVINKAAIVLTCAYWEAYNEDVCDEATNHICDYLNDPAKLPKELKKAIATAIREDKNELAMWDLASVGWKKVIQTNLAVTKKDIAALNTPKSVNIKQLVSKSLGIADITSVWKRHGLKPADAVKKLDDYVTLRGDIAHRGKALLPVKKGDAERFLSLASGFATQTDDHINDTITKLTGAKFF